MGRFAGRPLPYPHTPLLKKEDESMADQKSAQEGSSPPQQEERIPAGQILMDDTFFLLMLGLVVPTLLYLVWGLWETSVVPVFIP